MKPRELFDVLARILGLIVILYGAGCFVACLANMYQSWKSADGVSLHLDVAARMNAIYGLCYVVGGVLLMRGVISVARLAYGESLKSDASQS